MRGATEVIQRMILELVMVDICVKEHLDTIVPDFFILSVNESKSHYVQVRQVIKVISDLKVDIIVKSHNSNLLKNICDEKTNM
jgi:hypothetical protein